MTKHPARRVVFCLAATLLAGPAHAINVTLDYTYDTNDFFGAGNPDGAGAEATAALEAAAAFYSDLLEDTFSAIITPDPFVGQVSTQTWTWSATFANPGGSGSITVVDPSILEDEYRIYVGGEPLGGNTLGNGGIGGGSLGSSTDGPGFFPDELVQVQAISDAFSEAFNTRGEPSGFSRWGGSLTFDSDGSTNWHYDHTTQPSAGESDFFSVALHELGHTLGLGVSSNWDNWVTGTEYFGPAAVAVFGSNIPLDCDINGCGHWQEDTQSNVYGTTIMQDALMDPSLTQGTRELLTELDAAALTDIGWDVAPPPSFAEADYDQDGDVDGDDLARWANWFSVNGNGDADGDGDTDIADVLVWQKQYTGPLPPTTAVPEPSAAALLLLAAVAPLLFRPRPSAL